MLKLIHFKLNSAIICEHRISNFMFSSPLEDVTDRYKHGICCDTTSCERDKCFYTSPINNHRVHTQQNSPHFSDERMAVLVVEKHYPSR